MMRLSILIIVFGRLALLSFAAPVHNAEAGPSNIGGTPSGSTESSHPGGAPLPQPPGDVHSVEFGNVYQAKMANHRTGPSPYSTWPNSVIDENASNRAKENHRHKMDMPHPFIPTELHGDYYKGYVVTHKPPQGEKSLPAPLFGEFRSKDKPAPKKAPPGGIQKPYKKNGSQPKKGAMESRILKTPRYVHKAHILPGSDDVKLTDGKYDELKNRLCKRGYSHCSRQSKKSAKRKSSTISKIKAYDKHAKTRSNSPQKRKGSQRFAGKTKPMKTEKGPAGGRGISHTKKGRK